MKLYISPSFNSADKGDGGIRRVVEAQRQYLPDFGYEIVKLPEQADIIAVHAGNWINTDKPVVSHCHGLYWREYEWHNWHYQLNRDVIAAMRKADVVTAPSKWVANILARGMMLDAPVLYHGIEPAEWEPGNDAGYVLWNKTRTDPVCDPQPLNELAARAPHRRFVTTFGDSLPNVRVTDTLPYTEAKELIRNASVYLCTTRETFGIGTLEAMACGVPVLGFAWGGQVEFVQHKVNGYLVSPGDFDGLALGLEYCIDNREAMGAAARELVLSQFTWQQAIKRYALVYDDLLDYHRMVRPKVSVIIPCYNLGAYVERAVKSVAVNKFTDYEIIIVDDASDDPATLDVLRELPNKYANLSVIHNEQNQYLAETLNRGIREARGYYILPLDSDNEIGQNTLKVLSDALDNNRALDIVYGRMEVVEEDGTRFVSGWPNDKFDYRMQMAHRNQCPSTSMYRRRVWERTSGYRRRCRTAEDADFWCRASTYGFQPARVTDAVTLVYHNRSNSMSHVEQDWNWNDWYVWSRDESLTPFGAVVGKDETIEVPTYEPVLVSVVIPVGLGHSRLVLDAIDSVISQTFQKWELIVVNDTGSYIPDLPPFARVVQTEGLQGTGAARNIGIEAAKAKLFLLLDADDYLAPTAINDLYETYKTYGGYVYSDWKVPETGETYQAPEYDCAALLKKLPHAVTCLYEKSAWAKVGGFDESLQGWEDWDFMLRLAELGYCGIRCPKPLLYYRISTGSRRETAFANRKEFEKPIFARWKPYIEGSKQLMACGSCGGRKVANTTNKSASKMVAASPSPEANGLVLIEYTVEQQGSRTYKGQVTGRTYKFGTDSGHRIKYVASADAQQFLSRKHEFRLATEVQNDNEPILAAAGPPKR